MRQSERLNTDVKSQWAVKTIYVDYEQNLYSGLFTSMLIVPIGVELDSI